MYLQNILALWFALMTTGAISQSCTNPQPDYVGFGCYLSIPSCGAGMQCNPGMGYGVGTCGCVTNTRQSSDCSTCKIIPGYGCNGNVPCADGTTCQGNPSTCLCPPGQLAQNGQCLTTANGGCTADSQCVSGLYCINDACGTCPLDFIPQYGACVIPLNGACSSSSAQCASGYSCIYEKCGVCPSGTVAQNGECLTTPGGQCTATANCVSGTACLSEICSFCPPLALPSQGTCVCISGHQFTGNSCVQSRGLFY